jgi:hypothetical protein
MDNHVIDFPKKTIVINADDESATEVDLVNEGRKSTIALTATQLPEVKNLGTPEFPLTPQLDHIVNASISGPTIQWKTSRRRPVP